MRKRFRIAMSELQSTCAEASCSLSAMCTNCPGESNREFQVGGPKLHCEADEVASRCKTIRNICGGVGSIEWLRFTAVARRDHRKFELSNYLRDFGHVTVKAAVDVFH